MPRSRLPRIGVLLTSSHVGEQPAVCDLLGEAGYIAQFAEQAIRNHWQLPGAGHGEPPVQLTKDVTAPAEDSA